MQLNLGSLTWIVLVMVVERSWNEWKPRRSDFYKIRSLLQSKSHALRSHTLIVSNCYCHDRFISEPSAFKSSVCGRGPVADHWSTPLSSLYYKPMKLNVSKVTRVPPPHFPECILKYQGCSNKQSSVLIAPQSCSLYNLCTACSFLCYEAGIRESVENNTRHLWLLCRQIL